MFRPKGVSNNEIVRENYLKQNITSALGVSLKEIQQEFVSNNDYQPLRNEDAANNVCNVLEAAFLHGLKSSLTNKLSNILIGNDVTRESEPNFWEFVKKFTHRNVVLELRHLGQVTTETGFSRAWIRLALNEGLLENYVASMLNDSRTIDNHYKKTAYIRDTEHSDIFKMYLHGLTNVRFQLSYNSSLLNVWTTTPLVYAGLREAQIVDPNSNTTTIAKTVEHEEVKYMTNAEVNAMTESILALKTSTAAMEDNDNSEDEPIVAPSKIRSKQTRAPNNTPMDSSILTHSDVDYMRQLTAGRREAGGSISSSTRASQISHPDSTDHREAMWKSHEEVKMAEEKARKDKELKEAESEEMEKLVDDILKDDEDNDNVENDEVKIDYPENMDNKDLGADTSSQKKTLPAVQNVEVTNTTECVKVGTSETQSETSEDVPIASPVKRLSLKLGSLSVSPGSFSMQQQRGALTPVLSDDVAIAVPHVPRTDNGTKLKNVLQSTVAPTGQAMTVSTDSSEVHFSGTNSSPCSMRGDDDYGSYGNSLGIATGWSSTFKDPEGPQRLEGSTTSSISEQLLEASLDEPFPVKEKEVEEPPRSESFTHMLQTYGSESNPQSLPSMKQILGTFSDGSSHSIETIPSVGTPSETNWSIESTTDGDFEVLSLSSAPSPDDIRRLNFKEFFTELTNEQGLDSQNYQCKGCKRHVGIIYGRARVCSYDSCYYCYECHENDESFLPSKIIHNWDFNKYKVCKYNYTQLDFYEDDTLINIERHNSSLYDHVPEMNKCKKMRTQLYFLHTYLFSCKESVCRELSLKVYPKEYLYEEIHSYTMKDLYKVYQGQFAPFLQQTIDFCVNHVMSCKLCSLKGFICEICQSTKPIYPFQLDVTYRCNACQALYHQTCKSRSVSCPKCERRLKHKMVSSTDSSDFTLTHMPLTTTTT